MGFMEKLGATLATKYGEVTEGKHKGCTVALGNPPDKKVTTTNSFSQIIFLENKETVGRYDIGEQAKTLKCIGKNSESLLVEVLFDDGESSTIRLTTPKDDNAAVSILKKNFGLKSATKVNDDGTTATDNAVKYHNIKVFLETFFLVAEKAEQAKIVTYLKELGIN